MKAVLFQATREGYDIEYVDQPITAGELIDILTGYDEHTPIFLIHDDRSYGSLGYGKIIRIPG